MARKTAVKVTSHERGSNRHKYAVDLGDGRTAEVLFSRRPGGRVEVLGGDVTGCPPAEQVAAFREAADWLTRFVEQDGSPRPGLVDTDAGALSAVDVKEVPATQ